jgi:hypothetical protein
MKIVRLAAILLLSVLQIYLFACTENQADGEYTDESKNTSEGEEPGTRIANNETYDAVRNGVRLILNFDGTSSSFNGTVENISDQTISNVRVEIHLSNGTELGPTKQVDLAPGRKKSVNLSAKDQTFSWFKAHSETGEGGEEHKGEKDEHEGERKGEHGDREKKEGGEHD